MSQSAVLISCSDHYHDRMYLWDTCLQSFHVSTQYVTGDFHHRNKTAYCCTVPGSRQIHVHPYRKNLSVARILSHRKFAKDVRSYLESCCPNIVVALLPPNFLGHELAKYKKAHPDCILIFDIFDMWPETFPYAGVKKVLSPVFRIWSALRDHSLPAADHVVTECELFRRMLKLQNRPSTTVMLSASDTATVRTASASGDTIELCYLGSINNVIDIDQITALLQGLVAHKSITLHIIGKGEKEHELIRRAAETGAHVEFHGAIYNDVEKQNIMAHCHFGLNIMKPTVCVGLTMKSVDYFRFGLPVINNIPGDTAQLLQDYQAGIQLDNHCVRKIINITADQLHSMEQNSRKLFENKFSEPVVLAQITGILQDLLSGES